MSPSSQPGTDFRIRHLRERLGRQYTFQALLGRGAFATVYLVRNLRLNRLEALKVLSEDRHSEVGRFIQEAKLVATLDHPNIVKVYDFGEVDSIIWFSMQYVDGPTLRDELTARGRLTPNQVVHLAIPLLGALGYSHQMDTVHRDIKPSNILLDKRGHPYLMDFGIAKSSANVLKTATGNVLGTPAYVSPEQIQGHAVDGRTDLFALSVALYEMLAGQPPFKADEVIRTIMMRLHEDPEPLKTHCPSVPEAVESVIMRGLARRPEDRFPNAQAMSDALTDVLNRHSDQTDMIVLTAAPPPVAIERLSLSTTAVVDPQEAQTVQMRRERAEGGDKVPRRPRLPIRAVALAAAVSFALATMLFLWAPWNTSETTQVPSVSQTASQTPALDEADEGAPAMPASGETEEPAVSTQHADSTAPPVAVEPPSGKTPEPVTVRAEAEVSLPPPPAPPPPSVLSSPVVPPPPAASPSIRRPVTAPKIRSAAEPNLPPAQVAACAGQSVILSLRVGEDGTVTRARVLGQGPEACSEAARLAAEAYLFEPALDAQGEPVPASTTINVRFHEAGKS